MVQVATATRKAHALAAARKRQRCANAPAMRRFPCQLELSLAEFLLRMAPQVLLIVAATHLDAVAFQIFSQSFKLVPTALFAYWLLGQMLEPMQVRQPGSGRCWAGQRSGGVLPSRSWGCAAVAAVPAHGRGGWLVVPGSQLPAAPAHCCAAPLQHT